MPRVIALALTAGAVLWTTAIVLTPLDLAARVPVMSAVMYGAGGLVCHQRSERSFHVHGRRLPVCARCTALYVAGTVGALTGWIGRRRAPRRMRLVLIAAAAPMGLTVALEWAGVSGLTNSLRALSGVPLGAVAGWLFIRMLRSERPAAQMRYDSVI